MSSLQQKDWVLSTALNEKPLIDRVCEQRKVHPSNDLKELHSPWLLKDIEKAVKRIESAIAKKERIMIFGDYDVDGVSGASILYEGLKEVSAQVSVRLPHREKDGYGLNTRVLDECDHLEVKVLITVDCGISNVAEVQHGKDLGLDIIVTDHHAIPPDLPQAFAILNPKQEDCQYPDKEVCGSVVALKLVEALLEKAGKKNKIQDLIDLAALATVADCMPLRGENRLIVTRGLRQMQQTKHRGLRTLLESYELTKPDAETGKIRALTSYDLGFKIAPCINAAGRLEDPLIAFKMMMGDQAKALELRQLNQERQEVVRTALEEASEQVERDHAEDPILVFWQDHWPPGIVGLLAGRLCERFHRPVVCLTRHEEKYVGSCRSVPSINIVEHLQKHEELFLNYGGHAQAAGLSILPEYLEELRKRLHKDIGDWIAMHPLKPELYVDTEVREVEITLAQLEELSQLEPFGMGNPKPKFLLKNLRVEMTRAVGRDLSHLQLKLKGKEKLFKGIAFQMAEHQDQLDQWKQVDIVCQLNKNTFRGQTTVDLQVIDARKSL